MASKKILAAKKKAVDEIVEKIQKAKSVILIDYRGLTVLEDTNMRNALRKENIEYKVIKNRLMLRAFEKAGYKDFAKILEGPTAVAFGFEDAVAPAKILDETAKRLKKMQLKGGVAEGKTLNEAEVQALARIPSKPILVAQLLGLLTNPMRSLAVACKEIAAKKQA
ncbi:MAG: 50S ribosomal protein L10 [Firmicutes bacterium]|nr:50S ribosomal protein L10 [Bacillota bacterium]